MIEEEVEENVSIWTVLLCAFFYERENRFFAADFDEKREREREKNKNNLAKQKRKKNVFIFYHTHLKEPQHKTTEREDDFYDDIDDQNGFNTTTKIFVFSFLFLPKLWFFLVFFFFFWRWQEELLLPRDIAKNWTTRKEEERINLPVLFFLKRRRGGVPKEKTKTKRKK